MPTVKVNSASTVAEQKPVLTVWRNPNSSCKEVLRRTYLFWEKKNDDIARLYQQKVAAYEKALEEFKRVSHEYSEIIVKCRKARENYFLGKEIADGQK